MTAASRERARLNQFVAWAAMPETSRLKKTIDSWWPAIAMFIRTRATDAKTEAANGTIKNTNAPAAATARPELCRSML